MATRMQQRRGTAAEWLSVNPVLAPGEIGYELDTGVIKVGDGVTSWTDLPQNEGPPGPQGSGVKAVPDGTDPATLGLTNETVVFYYTP